MLIAAHHPWEFPSRRKTLTLDVQCRNSRGRWKRLGTVRHTSNTYVWEADLEELGGLDLCGLYRKKDLVPQTKTKPYLVNWWTMGLLSFLTELNGSHCAMREGEVMPHHCLESPWWGKKYWGWWLLMVVKRVEAPGQCRSLPPAPKSLGLCCMGL